MKKSNIQHIFSSLYHPISNGVMELNHKEIRKNLVIYYSHNRGSNINFKNALLDLVESY